MNRQRETNNKNKEREKKKTSIRGQDGRVYDWMKRETMLASKCVCVCCLHTLGLYCSFIDSRSPSRTATNKQQKRKEEEEEEEDEDTAARRPRAKQKNKAKRDAPPPRIEREAVRMLSFAILLDGVHPAVETERKKERESP